MIITQKLVDFNLSYIEYPILDLVDNLSEMGIGMSQTQMATILHIPKSTLNRVVERLIERGLLQKGDGNGYQVSQSWRDWVDTSQNGTSQNGISLSQNGSKPSQNGISLSQNGSKPSQNGTIHDIHDNTCNNNKIQGNTEINFLPEKSGKIPPKQISDFEEKKKRAPRAKTPAELAYVDGMKIYSDWYAGRYNTIPKIDGVGGKALKSILQYIRQAVKSESEDPEVLKELILRGWRLILSRWEELKDRKFLFEAVDLKGINMNINNIIAFYQNEKAKRNNAPRDAAAEAIRRRQEQRENGG